MIIRNVTNCIKGGYLAVITGDNLDKAKGVVLKRVKDDKKFYQPCINQTMSTVTFRVPEGEFAAYKVMVQYDENCLSNELFLNEPQIKWILEDGLCAGKELRIIGHGFVNIDLYKERQNNEPGGYADYVENGSTKVYLEGEETTELKIEKISNYEIITSIPENIDEGVYAVIVENQVLSEKYTIKINKKQEYPDKIFNVLDYGAKAIPQRDVHYNEFFDSAPSFQKALDAAHENGGGIVFIPNGRYCFKSCIRIYPFTKLIGEDKDRVWLELPKGMDDENGWGTFEEGEKIYTFIAGDAGDFTIENINIFGVYSPMLIAAPMIKGEPLIGDDVFNRAPLYSNLLDESKSADNIVIRNCNIIHEPTYLEDRKKINDPFRMGGYDNSKKEIVGINENYYARLQAWTAVAIKGDNLLVENNRVQGAGACIKCMGTNNATFRRNKLFMGDVGNCLAFFNTNYNPDSHWVKPIRNLIIEDNIMKPLTNVTRGVMYFMEDIRNCYIKNNKLDSFYWMGDTEGFCFHLWGNYFRMKAVSGNKTIKINMSSLIREHDAYKGLSNETTGDFKENVFFDYYFYVISGKGVGQARRVIANGNDYLELDRGLDCELDESSIIAISGASKFENCIVVKNELNDMGRGIYAWGGCHNSIIDNNILCGNTGILLEDLSWHYGGMGIWQHSGHLFNQILNNKMTVSRGFASNYGVVGVSGGTVSGSTTSVIIRGNVCEDDTVIVAKPRAQAKDGLNYVGVVIENNKSIDCETGIEVDSNISATLSKNEFENVEKKVVDCDSDTIIFA